MRLLYIAGPFSAPADDPDPLHTVEANIVEASRIALEAARKGWMPICPHKNSAGFQHCDDIPPEFWYEGDLELLRRCDAVVLMRNYTQSKGAVREAQEAIDRGIPTFFYDSFHYKHGLPDANEVMP